MYIYSVNFFDIEFDNLEIEASLLKAKLDKAIPNIKRMLEIKSLAILNKLQLWVSILSFAVKLVILVRISLYCLYDNIS